MFVGVSANDILISIPYIGHTIMNKANDMYKFELWKLNDSYIEAISPIHTSLHLHIDLDRNDWICCAFKRSRG